MESLRRAFVAISKATSKITEKSANINEKLNSCMGVNSHRLRGKVNPHLSIAEDPSLSISEDQPPNERKWRCRQDFRFALVAYVIGSTSMQTLPTAVKSMGGATFFIPYTFMLFFIAFPLTYLTILIGQFTGRGLLGSWEVCPIFKGIGYSIIVKLTLKVSNGMVSLARHLSFMKKVFSMGVDVVRVCNNTWNSNHCFTNLPDVDCERELRAENGTCYMEHKSIGIWNHTKAKQHGIWRRGPFAEYFEHEILQASDAITEQGHLVTHLVVSLALSWLIMIFPIVRGVRNYGWVYYIITILPLLVHTIFFCLGLFISGGIDGFQHGLSSAKHHLLLSSDPWKEAMIVCYDTLGSHFAGFIWLASFNYFQHQCVTDTLFLFSCFIFMGMLAVFKTFVSVGIAAENIPGVNISTIDIMEHHYEPSFEGIAYFPSSSLSLFVYGLTIFLFQFGVMAITSEMLVDSFMSRFKNLQDHKGLITVTFCLTSFFIGLIFCTQGGIYNSQLTEMALRGFCDFVLTLLILLIFMGIYGWPKWSSCILTMKRGIHVWKGWRFFWSIITPGLVFGFLVFTNTFVTLQRRKLGDETWISMLCFGIISLVLMPIFICAIAGLCQEANMPIKARIKKQFTQTMYWGPQDFRERRLLRSVSGFRIDQHSETSISPSKLSPSPRARADLKNYQSDTEKRKTSAISGGSDLPSSDAYTFKRPRDILVRDSWSSVYKNEREKFVELDSDDTKSQENDIELDIVSQGVTSHKK